MSALDKILGPPSPPPEYGQPEQGFLAPEPRLTVRWFIVMAAISIAVPRLADVSGFNAFWRRHVPEWGDGLVIVALGLFMVLWSVLRSRRPTADRRAMLILGSLIVAIGALFSYFSV